MSYADLPPDVQAVAERVLTRKQLDVFKLHCSGIGSARIALIVGVSEPVARRTLARAQQLIHLERSREVA